MVLLLPESIIFIDALCGSISDPVSLIDPLAIIKLLIDIEALYGSINEPVSVIKFLIDIDALFGAS